MLVHRGAAGKKKRKPQHYLKRCSAWISNSLPFVSAPFALPCTHSELPWTPNICSACRHLPDNNDIIYSDSHHSCCKVFGSVFNQNTDTKFKRIEQQKQIPNKQKTNHQLSGIFSSTQILTSLVQS